MCEVKGETNVCSAHVENSSDFIHSPRESTSIAVDQSSVERDEEHLSLETYFLDVSRACFFLLRHSPFSRGVQCGRDSPPRFFPRWTLRFCVRAPYGTRHRSRS